MTDSYNQKNINLEGQDALNSFIFDPSAAAQTDIIFTDWNALLGKLSEIQGIKEIIIPAGGGAKSIPAGIYDMTDIILSGDSPISVIDVNDVQFQNLSKITSLLLTIGFAVANTVPTLTYNDVATHRLTLEGVSFAVGPLAAFPFVDISAGSSLGLSVHTSDFISANVVIPVFAIDATSSLANSPTSSSVGNTWGGGPGSPAFVTVAAGGSFTLRLSTGDVFWSTDNPLGPTSIIRADDYEEDNLANWNAAAPLNVKNALDRIAAVIGPIPV